MVERDVNFDCFVGHRLVHWNWSPIDKDVAGAAASKISAAFSSRAGPITDCFISNKRHGLNLITASNKHLMTFCLVYLLSERRPSSFKAMASDSSGDSSGRWAWIDLIWVGWLKKKKIFFFFYFSRDCCRPVWNQRPFAGGFAGYGTLIKNWLIGLWSERFLGSLNAWFNQPVINN